VSADRTPRERYLRAARQQAAERRRSPTPVPARITLALDSAGLDGPDVDEALGVQEPAVDRWEEGVEVPTGEQVNRLAALTGFPAAFFYEPIHAPPMQGFVCQRSGPGKGCHRFDQRPDAQITELHPDTLF
jgi:hypothetical protein